MYLKYHFGLYTFRLKALVYAYHSYLDNIGCTSLDRSIDGIPFGISAHTPCMEEKELQSLYSGWREAVKKVIGQNN